MPSPPRHCGASVSFLHTLRINAHVWISRLVNMVPGERFVGWLELQSITRVMAQVGMDIWALFPHDNGGMQANRFMST